MKNVAYKILGTLLTFVGFGAIITGFLMILHPDGFPLNMSPDILQNTPFPNYLIPVLFLFLINGIFNLLAALLTFLKNRYSGPLGILLGSTLIAWIIVQICFIGFSSFLQPLFFLIGVLEMILGFIIQKRNKRTI